MKVIDGWGRSEFSAGVGGPGDQVSTRVQTFKSFVPSPEGQPGVGWAAPQARRPIPVNLSVSRCASVPIPLDSPHSASTQYQNCPFHIHKGGKRDGRTDEVFLTGVKPLSISIEPKLLFAAHLNITRKND